MALVRLGNRQTVARNLATRIRIILHVQGRAVNFSAVARELGHDRQTIKCWYQRAAAANEFWQDHLLTALRSPGQAGERLRRERLVKAFLSDHPRSGAPPTYSIEEYTRIVSLALTSPTEYGRPITHWTSRELTDEVRIQKLAAGISERQIQRFLKQADLKPHRSQYWLNPKIDDPEEYERQAREICDLYLHARQLREQGIHLISTDEKTGMQALARIAPTKPMRPGMPEKIEFEYVRNGTLCLIPSFEVATGRIVEFHLGPQRTEEDFCAHIRRTVAPAPDQQWIFISDQLDTHRSEALVRFVAQEIGFTGDLGTKGKSGILQNKASRTAFLTDKGHRIRLVYTPKHCSWLNQVEIWFGILSRKVLKRGNFSSVEDLAAKVSAFIEYFNRTMAKPYKWTCTGIPLKA